MKDSAVNLRRKDLYKLRLRDAVTNLEHDSRVKRRYMMNVADRGESSTRAPRGIISSGSFTPGAFGCQRQYIESQTMRFRKSTHR